MAGFIFWLIFGIAILVIGKITIRKFAPETTEEDKQPFNERRFQELFHKYGTMDSWDSDRLEGDEKKGYEEFRRMREEKERRRDKKGRMRLSSEVAALLTKVVTVVGWAIIVFAVCYTSYIFPSSGESGHLKRSWFGRAMRPGQIIAEENQNGPQMRIIPPGFHAELFIRILYKVEMKDDIVVPTGKVLTITANDGRDKPKDQLFADPWPDNVDKKRMLEDAGYALSNGLQKGPQVVAFGPGTYRFNQYLYSYDTNQETVKIGAGELGLCKANYGKRFDYELFKDKKSKFYNMFPEKLVEGEFDEDRPVKDIAIKAALVPHEWKPTASEPTFNYGWLDDPNSRWYGYYPKKFNLITREMVIEAKLVPPEYIGNWWQPLTEGEYAINRAAVQVFVMESKTQTFNYYGGFSVDSTGVHFDQDSAAPEGRADWATDAISNDGFLMAIDYRVQARVLPEQAPYAYVMWGTWLDIENKAITPDTRSSMRNNGQNVPCLDYFKNRQRQERKTFAQLWTQFLRKGFSLVDVNYGQIHIPPELLETQTRQVLAEQNKLAWDQERIEQEARIKMENQRATADQQEVLVKAEIAEKAAGHYKNQRQKDGQGEGLYYKEKADGLAYLYGALSEQIGPDGVILLETMSRLKEMGVTDITPEVFYQSFGGQDGELSKTFGPLNGTILHDMIKGASPFKGIYPEEMMQAQPQDATSVKQGPAPTPIVEPKKQ